MLTAMREGARSGFLRIILFGFMGMAVFGLVLMDVGGFFRGGVASTTVAEIQGQELSLTTFDQTVRNTLAQQGIDTQTAYHLGLIGQLLQSEITRNVLYGAARDQGLIVSDETVARQINSIITPMISEDMTRAQALEMLMRYQGLSEGALVQSIRTEMTNTILRNALQLAAEPAGKREARHLYLYENEARDISYVLLRDADISALPDSSDDILKAFYQAGRERYAVPEMRGFTVAVLDRKALEESIEIDDSELRQIYEDEIADFSYPERRKVLQAVFDSESQASSALSKIRGDMSLEDAARDVTGAGNAYLGAGTFEREGLITEIGDAVFTAESNAKIGPVQSALGWHVLTLEAIEEPRVRAFEEVRESLEREIRQAQLYEYMFSMANTIDDQLAGGTPLEEISDLTLTKIAPVRADGSTADDRDGITSFSNDQSDILAMAFDLMEGETGPVIELHDGRFAAIRIDEIIPRRYKDFEEVREEIETAWITDQRQSANRNRAVDFLNSLQNGEKTLDQVASGAQRQVKNMSLIRKEAPGEPFSRNARDIFFNLLEGDYAMAPTEGGILIGQVTRVTMPEEPEDIASETADFQALLDHLESDNRAEATQIYTKLMEDRFRVKINHRLLERQYGGESANF